MATEQSDKSALFEAIDGALNEERISTINGATILLDEPNAAECAAAFKEYGRRLRAAPNKKRSAKEADDANDWHLALIKRVLPKDVREHIGDDNLRRFIVVTGGWFSELGIQAMRLHGIPIPKDIGKGVRPAVKGDPANPTTS